MSVQRSTAKTIGLIVIQFGISAYFHTFFNSSKKVEGTCFKTQKHKLSNFLKSASNFAAVRLIKPSNLHGVVVVVKTSFLKKH